MAITICGQVCNGSATVISLPVDRPRDSVMKDFHPQMRILPLIAIGTLGCLAGFGADWLTDGVDSQRTSWQRDEKILSTSTVKGMKLLWKVKLDNKPHEMHALFPPLIVSSAATSGGPKEIAIVAGSGDNIFAIDVAKGVTLWNKHFDSGALESAGGRGGGTLCPGGLTATPVIGPGSAPGKYTVYAASWDGSLHQLNVADGEDLAPPAKFMPPNGKPYGLNLFNGVIYTTTGQGCGGNPNLVYAYDLATHKVGTYSPARAACGAAKVLPIAPDGTLYTGTGDGSFHPENQSFGQAIIGVKQDPATKALALQDYYGPSNAEWLLKRDLDIEVSPPYSTTKGAYPDGWQSSKECRIWLMDAKSLGGDDHRTPLDRTPVLCNEQVNMNLGIWGAMATWEDSKGTRWIVAPLWGPLHSGHPCAARIRPGCSRCNSRFQIERYERSALARPGLDFPRHESGGPARDRKRCSVRIRQRRKRDAPLARSGAYFRHCRKNRRIDARRVVRARRSNGKRAVVQWRSDRVLESFQRYLSGEWPGLHWHL